MRVSFDTLKAQLAAISDIPRLGKIVRDPGAKVD